MKYAIILFLFFLCFSVRAGGEDVTDNARPVERAMAERADNYDPQKFNEWMAEEGRRMNQAGRGDDLEHFKVMLDEAARRKSTKDLSADLDKVFGACRDSKAADCYKNKIDQVNEESRGD